MAAQDGLTFEGTFNNGATGLYKDNTTNDISEADLRALPTAIRESYLNRIDDAYTGIFPQFTTATSTTTYTGTANPAITAYATGQKFQIKAHATSTGDATLSLNGVGAKKWFKTPTAQATTGDIVINQIYIVAYDAALDTAAGGFLMIGSPTTSGGGHVIEEEGTPLTQRTKLNFVGAGVTATDDGGDDATVVTIPGAGAIVGVQDMFIPSTAMWPRVTNGCSVVTKEEVATSLFNIQYLAFDQTTQEFCNFQFVAPRKWNNGTITAVFYWTALSGSGDVQWGIRGGAYSNDDPLSGGVGTAQTSDDTLITALDVHISPETSPITLEGTPAASDFLGFTISRNPAADTLNEDALLLGVSLRFTTNAAIDG